MNASRGTRRTAGDRVADPVDSAAAPPADGAASSRPRRRPPGRRAGCRPPARRLARRSRPGGRRPRRVVVVLTLAAPETAGDAAAAAEAEAGRIARFREETREERMQVAREAEHATAARSPGGAAGGDPGRCSPRCRCR